MLKVGLIYTHNDSSDLIFSELVKRKEVFDCLWFDLEQEDSKENFSKIKKKCEENKVLLGVIKLPFLKKKLQPSEEVNIPATNLFFLIEALKYYDIVYVPLSNDEWATSDYIDSLTKLIANTFGDSKRVFFPTLNTGVINEKG